MDTIKNNVDGVFPKNKKHIRCLKCEEDVSNKAIFVSVPLSMRRPNQKRSDLQVIPRVFTGFFCYISYNLNILFIKLCPKYISPFKNKLFVKDIYRSTRLNQPGPGFLFTALSARAIILDNSRTNDWGELVLGSTIFNPNRKNVDLHSFRKSR